MPANTKIRAKRFPLHFPLQYRRADSTGWQKGKSVDISCSGVLFRCRHPLKSFTPVELVLPLPGELAGESSISLLCSGYIARVVEARLPFRTSSMAAAFLSYRLLQENGERMRRLQQVTPAVPSPSLAVHDFYNQLAIVIGNSELILADARNSPETQDRASRIKEAGNRLLSVMRGLLNL